MHVLAFAKVLTHTQWHIRGNTGQHIGGHHCWWTHCNDGVLCEAAASSACSLTKLGVKSSHLKQFQTLPKELASLVQPNMLLNL